MPVFRDFEAREIPTSRGNLRAMIGGAGPPVLLLHGYPQTHLMWHAVAPLLADSHTVIATDLAGYGDSFRPTPAPDHQPHSKRAMALDQVEAMTHLGLGLGAEPGRYPAEIMAAYRDLLDDPTLVQALCEDYRACTAT
jgi:haloacetate dehalogenase